MELPNEWVERSKIAKQEINPISDISALWISGAQQYANAVEALKILSKNIEAHACYLQEQKGFEQLLSDLPNLTPLK